MKLKARSISFIAALVVCVVVVAVGLGGVWLYSGSTTNAKFAVLVRLALPVAKIGSISISARELQDIRSLAPFLEQYGTSETEILQLRALAVGKVTASNQEISEAQTALLNDAAYRAALRASNPGIVRDVLVRNYVLQNKLRAWYAAAGIEPGLVERLMQVTQRLKSGQSFADVAAQYSDDTATKWFMGDTGYVAVDALVPEYRRELLALAPHSQTVIYSRFGAHVVMLLDAPTKDGAQYVRVQEIVLQTKNFDSWLRGQEQQLPVVWYIQK